MDLKTAVKLVLIMSGKYDTKSKFVVKGFDEYRNQKIEYLDGLDIEKLDEDVDKAMKAYGVMVE